MVEKWKSEVGKDEKPLQDSDNRDISVESRLLNTEKFLEKHLMDNLMRYVIFDIDMMIYEYYINLLASKLRNFETGNLTLAFIETVNKKGQTVMGKD